MRRHGISFISSNSMGVMSGLLALKPSLKHQHVPQVILPVALAGQMFPPFLLDGRWIEEALSQKAGWIEQALRPLLQRTAQPGIDGYAEAHFRPLDQLPGYMTVKYFSKQPLGYPAAHLELKGQPPSEF